MIVNEATAVKHCGPIGECLANAIIRVLDLTGWQRIVHVIAIGAQVQVIEYARCGPKGTLCRW